MEYSIVIPTYNESNRITASLTHVLSFMRSYSPSFEIIVSDDGSVDNTAQLVEDYTKENSEVLLLKNEHKGKAAALVSGVRRASGSYIYLADADFASSIEEIKKLSVWVKEQNFDIAIASREGPGSERVGEPYYRHFVGRVFNLLVQIVALPGIQDSQCGFKLFKADVAKRIFSKLVVYSENNKPLKKPFFGALDVEILYLARKMGYSIKPVGVLWTFVKTSRFNFLENTYRMARDLFYIRLTDILGKYKV